MHTALQLGFLFQLQYLHQFGLLPDVARPSSLISTPSFTTTYPPCKHLPLPQIFLTHHTSNHHQCCVISIHQPASPIRCVLGLLICDDQDEEAKAHLPSHSRTITTTHQYSPHTRPRCTITETPNLCIYSYLTVESIQIEVTLPPRKRLGIALSPGYKVGESSSAAAARPAGGLREDYGFVATMDREIRCNLERHVGYGIIDSWDKIVETMQGAPASANTELGRHMTDFETRVRQDTDEIYTRLDDEQTERQLLAGQLNMLFRDRRAHARTARLMEAEARIDAGSVPSDAVQSHQALKLVKETTGLRLAEVTEQQGPAKGPFTKKSQSYQRKAGSSS
ncbi:hypothetical protein Tco_1522181 [Tanacetum coccineum]